MNRRKIQIPEVYRRAALKRYDAEHRNEINVSDFMVFGIPAYEF